MNLGCSEKGMVTEDPAGNCILPIDDEIWENSVRTSNIKTSAAVVNRFL